MTVGQGESALPPPPVEEVLLLAQRAGERLLEMQAAGVEVATKEDGSKVTAADHECNELIIAGLRRITPDIPVIAEENRPEENERILQEESIFWTVDPLDVTDNYIAGRPDYSVNIALVKNGIPVQGVLLFPAHGDVYFTGNDGLAYCKKIAKGNPEPQCIRVKDFTIRDVFPFSASSTFAMAIKPRHSGDAKRCKTPFVSAITSAGQRRACMVASGEVILTAEDAGYRIWDSAPACAIVRAAGGDMRDENGKSIGFDSMTLPSYTVAHKDVLDKLVLAQQSRHGR